MRWPHKQPANIGDHRWNIKFAWLPTLARKQNANNCTKWDKYTVWFEYYDCHEEYKHSIITGEMWWEIESNYVLDPIIK